MTMKPDARFWDRMAERYARMPISDEAAYQRKLALTQAHFRPDWRLWEFGCGTGSTALAHAPHVASILATDLSAAMLEIARRKAAEQSVDTVAFRQAGIDAVEAEPESFDGVLGLNVLHLLADPQAAIGAAHRSLKPGGIFVSNTACIAEMSPLLRLVVPVAQFFGKAPYVNAFTRADLRRMVREAGFVIEEDWEPGSKGRTVFLIARKPAS